MRPNWQWRSILLSKNIRFACLFLTAVLVTGVLQAEIINVSRLEKMDKEKKEFSIERDIFSPFKKKYPKPGEKRTVLPPPPPPREEKVQETKAEPSASDVADETRRTVAYEGYVIRNTKRLALLTVSGEFFVVGKEDIILDKIKVINVEKKHVTVEVASNPIEIKLKGDDELQ